MSFSRCRRFCSALSKFSLLTFALQQLFTVCLALLYRIYCLSSQCLVRFVWPNFLNGLDCEAHKWVENFWSQKDVSTIRLFVLLWEERQVYIFVYCKMGSVFLLGCTQDLLLRLLQDYLLHRRFESGRIAWCIFQLFRLSIQTFQFAIIP